MPEEIKSLSQFNKLKAGPLLIIDFYATWCGPCKAISPVFERLSKQHTSTPSITFAQVDVDKARDVASTCGISAMPTFQFFKNGSMVDEIKGADVQQLTTKIGYYTSAVIKESTAPKPATTASSSSSSASNNNTSSTPSSLRSLIDLEKSHLLNTTLLSNIRNIISPPPKGYALASVTGKSQLLIHLAFTQPTTPSQIHLTIPSDSQTNAPARLQIGANVPVNISTDQNGAVSNDLSMQSLAKAEKSQAFNVYSDEYVGGRTVLKLKGSVFTGVRSVTIRIDANLSGDETVVTRIGEMDVVGVRA